MLFERSLAASNLQFFKSYPFHTPDNYDWDELAVFQNFRRIFPQSKILSVIIISYPIIYHILYFLNIPG